jgi:hypothetical protein
MRIDNCKMQNERRDTAEFAFCISHFNFFNDSRRVGKGTQRSVPPPPSFQDFHQPWVLADSYSPKTKMVAGELHGKVDLAR